METTLHRARRPLRIASTGVLGMSTGAMALIRVALVPSWRSADPSEFRAWFAANSGRIRTIMGPLGAAGVVSSLGATAIEARTEGAPALAAVAAAASAGVVAITLTLNEPANAKFVQPDFDDAATSELLNRWVRWHDVRVGLGVLATTAGGLVATSPNGR